MHQQSMCSILLHVRKLITSFDFFFSEEKVVALIMDFHRLSISIHCAAKWKVDSKALTDFQKVNNSFSRSQV